MQSPTSNYYFARLFMRHRRLVYTTADQGVIDICYRHKSCRKGNCLASQALGIAAAVPLFMVRECDFLGHLEQRHANTDPLKCVFNCIATEGTVRHHDLEFIRIQRAWLEQNPVNASVEKVEQGSSLVDQAGETMGELVTSIQKSTNLMREISSASNEQANGVAQVGEAVTLMDQTTQQNAALVEQMAAAANSL